MGEAKVGSLEVEDLWWFFRVDNRIVVVEMLLFNREESSARVLLWPTRVLLWPTGCRSGLPLMCFLRLFIEQTSFHLFTSGARVLLWPTGCRAGLPLMCFLRFIRQTLSTSGACAQSLKPLLATYITLITPRRTINGNVWDVQTTSGRFCHALPKLRRHLCLP